ncbi:glycosyltransferase family 2 protein [Salinivibrio sp. DV]|uniref:glycosyltransferase family 2 protein n=1 Tax=Salinivibrio sp. SS2 TaxID=1892894 RepID=UPI00084BFA63|nr:glycosyltransferase [Salinivibrio sp. DV]ODP99259.1 hypothetical protein BGK46_10865 [Salinivibrio sp. DV]
MKKEIVKYSVILPVYNGIDYIENCINTIINQDYDDYELIIVDDCSNDGTREYLKEIEHPNINIVFQKENLGAIGNFSSAISFATGNWVIFLGVDDGLQSYFFDLADRLTNICERKGLRIIASSRAHYFWEGASKLHGNKAVQYTAREEFSVLDSNKEIFLSLLGAQAYFELPQMYSNSLFHRSLLVEAKEKQDGHLFLTVPPDVNLAAIGLTLEKKYLKSFIPLGWVGTSSSATKYRGKDSDDNGVIFDQIRYDILAGKPSLGSLVIYLWNALLCTKNLRNESKNRLYKTQFFKIFVFSSAMAELRKRRVLRERKPLFDMLLSRNELREFPIFSLSFLIGVFSFMIFNYRRVKNKIKNVFKPSFHIKLERKDSMCMLKESQRIAKNLESVIKKDNTK